jgi:hypothetical protein
VAEDIKNGRPSAMPPPSMPRTHKAAMSGAPNSEPSILSSMTALKSVTSCVGDDAARAGVDDEDAAGKGVMEGAFRSDRVKTGRAEPSAYIGRAV